MEIDLNADLGEGAGFDAELMPLITSANVCCGSHAGSPEDIRIALQLALAHNVAVGAHPGFADRENFGRTEQAVSAPDVLQLCAFQLDAIFAIAASVACPIRYVKPHGALYNQVARDRKLADAVVTVARWFGNLPVVGLPHSAMQDAANASGHPFIAEGYADRRYRADGSLVPRTEANAFVHNPTEAVEQVEWLIREKNVRTICIHGDNPEAVAFATAVRTALLARGFTLKAFA
jgi:UPF0271 protein